MVINTRTVPEGRSEKVVVIANNDNLPEWPRFSQGLTCDCRFDKASTGIMVEIHYSGRFSLECARCLEPFEQPVQGSVRATLLHVAAGIGRTSDEEHAVYTYDDQHEEVDISPTIFDEIVTSLPMKPLCVEDCPGIQLPMGVTLLNDEEQPRSGEARVDQRWSALRKLRNEASPD